MQGNVNTLHRSRVEYSHLHIRELLRWWPCPSCVDVCIGHLQRQVEGSCNGFGVLCEHIGETAIGACKSCLKICDTTPVSVERKMTTSNMTRLCCSILFLAIRIGCRRGKHHHKSCNDHGALGTSRTMVSRYCDEIRGRCQQGARRGQVSRHRLPKVSN